MADIDQPLTEARIGVLVELAQAAILKGISVPLALAALETHLVRGLEALREMTRSTGP